jgi:HAD superfamily hydrolase (TIGR01509 family)
MTSTPPKAIFWDNDGVLVDTEQLYFEATRQILAPLGVDLTEAEYLEWFLIRGRGAWHVLENRGLGSTEIDRLRDARNELYASWLRERPLLLPGVVDALAALHGRSVMGVVTSSRRDHFDLIHEKTGVLQYFDFVLTAGDYARSKPHPDPYLRAVERSGVDPEDCLAIEDSERGLEAATRAGLRCIVIPTTLTRGCRFAAAHVIVASARDVPAAIGAT